MPKLPKNKKNLKSIQAKWIEYKKQKAKHKITNEKKKLTLKKYYNLTDQYYKNAVKHHDLIRDILFIELNEVIKKLKTKLSEKEKKKLKKLKNYLLNQTIRKTVSSQKSSYLIINEIIKDFNKTKKLNVLEFGSGYGLTLFFLKNYMKAKTKGIEITTYQKDIIAPYKLGIKYGIDADYSEIKKMGKFDVTFSINFFENDLFESKKAIKILDNIAKTTKKGGKSYHLILKGTELPVSMKEIRKKGFTIKLIKFNIGNLFILTKIN